MFCGGRYGQCVGVPRGRYNSGIFLWVIPSTATSFFICIFIDSYDLELDTKLGTETTVLVEQYEVLIESELYIS